MFLYENVQNHGIILNVQFVIDLGLALEKYKQNHRSMSFVRGAEKPRPICRQTENY